MSRRKQANPRPLKALDDNIEAERDENLSNISYKMVAVADHIQLNGDTQQDSDPDDFDEYGPLVVDTSRQTFDDDDEKDTIDQERSTSGLHLLEPPSDLGPHLSAKLSPAVVSVAGQQDAPSSLPITDLHHQSIDDHLPLTNNDPNLPPSRTPSISSSDQLSPGGFSSSISSSKTHRRGIRNHSICSEKDLTPKDDDQSENKILPVASETGESRYVCPICNHTLSSSHELTVHIRTHNTQTGSATQANSCTICGKSLSSQSSLDRHMLVHSGERPFRCKYCNMSFTTNGNMHRHMRIHTKETEVNAVGVKVQRKRAPSWKPKVNSFIHIEPASSKPVGGMPRSPQTVGNDLLQGSQLAKELTSDSHTRFQYGNTSTPKTSITAGTKRSINFINMSPGEWSVPSVKRNKLFDEGIKQEIETAQSNQQATPRIVATSSADKSVEDIEVFEGDDKEVEQLHCPACNKAFICKYGLENHIRESHPNFSLKCNLCYMNFHTLRSLSLHKTLVHAKARKAEKEDEECKEEVKAAAAAVIGFYDLSFVDFSIKKFSLIAKSWCEQNARKSSSVYHNFVCKECSKAFPCKGALKLHLNTHSRAKTSQCPLCECDYMTTKELHQHMIKHMSDKAFAEAQKPVQSNRRKPAKDPKAEEVGKHDFLASFGLTANVESLDVTESEQKAVSSGNNKIHERKENNEYFAKLGQIFSPNVSPINPFKKMESAENDNDFANIAKMLQTSATGGLLAGLPGAGLEQQLGLLNPSQLAAFMPSLLNSYNHPSFSSTMAAMLNASHMMSLANQGASSPLSTPPPSGEGNSSRGSASSPSNDSKIAFPCKYCDLVFPNYRALKSHTRTHLGLSPYKCNLCSYSSADKSTLIRHLRTHNGERPFQCRVCDFAFTTKANCERHVRKKHGKIVKEDIEMAIGYNKYVTEHSTMDSFHSPDTVCKYCGVDFKFFRALKHHLRSHSSCRQKPFQCTRCDVGFSTKANCIRHIQKQHTEISQNHIEQYILVHEPLPGEGSDRSDGALSDDNTSQESPSHPPVAHSNSRLSMTPNSSRTESPLVIKTEPIDPDMEDRPLDFSVKSSSANSTPSVTPRATPNSKVTKSLTDELPMDLSIKKKSESPVMMSNNKSSKVMYDNTLHQCQFCPMGFSSQRVLDRHVWQLHPQIAEIMGKRYFTPILPSPADKSVTPGNLRLPLKPPIGDAALDNRSQTPKSNNSEVKKSAIIDKIKCEPSSPSGSTQGNDPNCDLASVKKIIDTTNANHFQLYLQENIGDSDSQDRSEAADGEYEDLSMPEISDMDREESALVIAEDPPVLSPRSKADTNSETRSLNGDEEMPDLNKLLSSELRQQIQAAQQAEREYIPNHQVEKVKGDNTKKKRNSYADSPHKLQCPYCTRTFPWVSSLTRHLLTHTGQKPFKCPKCPVTFSTKSNRERHLIRKHGVNMMDPLSRQTMDRPYKCHLCVFSSFSTQGNLLKHYKERHSGCSLPESLVDLDKAVTTGLATTLSGEERSLARDRALGITNDDVLENSSYAAEEQLNQSMENERPDDRFMSINMDPSCKSDNEEDDDLVMTSPSLTTMEDINNSINTSLNSSSKQFSGSAERQINPERDNYNVDKITECWNCGEKFVSRKLLVRHLKEHNIDLPFKCYLCDASYDVRLDCLLHQEKFHATDWVILKDKNKVDNIDSFSRHMDKVVENNCNKVDQGVILEIPGQSADDPKMEVVSADYMQRKVYCSLCPKRFWSLQDLRRHMRSHTGERPFECDICQKRFTLKHSMMRHRKKHMETGSLSPSDDEDTNTAADDLSSLKIKGPRLLPKPSPNVLVKQTAIPIQLSQPVPVRAMTNMSSVPVIAAMPTMATMSAMPTIHLSNSYNAVSINGDKTREGQSASNAESKLAPSVTATLGSALGSIGEGKDNDILHSLLGVEMGSIDSMLDSADSAARLLGVN